MLLSLVYFVLCRLLHAVGPSDRSDLEREAEMLVLQHQLKVISRGVRRPIFAGETGCCSLRQAGSCPGSVGARSSFLHEPSFVGTASSCAAS
jgi:hypothetical protein